MPTCSVGRQEDVFMYVCIAGGFVSFMSPLLGSGKEGLDESRSTHKWEGCRYTVSHDQTPTRTAMACVMHMKR